jgi:hypothetical protein
MTDGLNSVETIRKACGMSPNSVLKLWNEGESFGLVRQLPGGRREKVFDAVALAMVMPEE